MQGPVRMRTIAGVALIAGLISGSWGCSKGGVNAPCREQQDCKSGLMCCPHDTTSIGACKQTCVGVSDGGQPDGGVQDAGASDAGMDAATPSDAGSTRDAGSDAGAADGG